MLPLLLAMLILGPPASAQVSISGQFDPAGAKQAAGRSVSFTCQVTNKQPLLSVRLTCPLAKVGTICFENCNRICADPSLCAEEPRLLRVTCSKSSAGSVQTFAYRLDMLDTGFSGDWGCKHVTYESTPRSLTVYPSPAIDSLDFTAATVVESQSTAALCVAQPTVGSLRFSWTRRDGLSIPHSSSGPNATASRLTIASAQRTDDAVYVCTVENEVGVSASREAGLTVNYPPSSVRLSSSLSSPLQAGVSVTFACQVGGGRPEPLRRFYRERLGQSREELPAATVTLEAADNAAKFYCKAESVGIIGTEVWSSPIAFSVSFPPSGLELLQQPPGPATDGGPAKQFSCSATSSSNPPSSAAWYSISPLGLQEQISDSRVSVSQTDGPNSPSSCRAGWTSPPAATSTASNSAASCCTTRARSAAKTSPWR
ncbi:hypothetical protein BOX15_Mlig006319g3 [Macrostomum lignano]|uniref:Ig-like domain-containing protein n=1 Tax=Macrostomum lignano TaxID=282301 RepID=A0A267DY47_9PLAT|nr:hypothetical protein BOX15_Mlig006319g3 [Macrostomum lignano]